MISFFFDIPINYGKSFNKVLTLPRQNDKVCANDEHFAYTLS